MDNVTNTTVAQDLIDIDPIFRISKADHEQVAFITNTILTPIICALGLVGNCLGVGVLFQGSRKEKLTIYMYLFTLTVLDTIQLFMGLIRSGLVLLSLRDFYMANYLEKHLQRADIYIDSLIAYSASTIMLVMGVERLNALLRPFNVKDSVFSQYPKRIIACSIVLNGIFLCPYALYFDVVSFVNFENRTEYYLQFKPDAVELMTRYMIVQTIVTNYIPGILSLVVNIGIAIAFVRFMRSRRNLTSSASSSSVQQIKVTFAVFTLTLMYLLFTIPDLFIKSLGYVDEGYTLGGKYQSAFWLFLDLINLFRYCNAANDFIIYILVSDHYRSIFKQMYCRCFLSKADIYGKTSGASNSHSTLKSSSSLERF